MVRQAEGSVLHVVHGLGSGVEAVVLDYAAATPELEHHAFFSADQSCHDPAFAVSPLLTSATRVQGGLLGFGRALDSTVRRLRPDVLHAHSSVAGGVVRLRQRPCPVVYTPHCYAFLRRDLPRPVRHGLRQVERTLASRADVVACCSPHEADLARALHSRSVHYVPNVAAAPTASKVSSPEGHFRVVASGRVSEQKGVGLFAELARRLRATCPGVDMVWVGGGDAILARTLTEAGVTVTGWLDRAEALRVVAGADAYVHCAAWEAAPLTVLEAAQADVPVLARASEPLRALGLAPMWDDLAEVADQLRDLVGGGDAAAYHRSNAGLRARHHADAQRTSLLHCYVDLLPGQRGPAPVPAPATTAPKEAP